MTGMDDGVGQASGRSLWAVLTIVCAYDSTSARNVQRARFYVNSYLTQHSYSNFPKLLLICSSPSKAANIKTYNTDAKKN